MVAKSQRLERIFAEAAKMQKKYAWLEAAELYGQALGMVEKGDLRKGKIHEQTGHCFHRAAFQAEDQEEFKKRIRQSLEAYDKAVRFYGKLADGQKARMFRCKAVAKYLGSWLTRDASNKRVLLDQCLEFEERALMAFTESRDTLEIARTYNELPLVFWLRVDIEWDIQISKSIIERGLKWGEKAITPLSKLENPHEIARAYFTLATCLSMNDERFIEEPERQEQNRQKIRRYLSEAIDLSEKVGDAHISGASNWLLGAWDIEEKEATRCFQRTLECGRLTRDNLLIAFGLDWLAYRTIGTARTMDDPGKGRELAEKAMQLYDQALHHYSKTSLIGPRSDILNWPAGYAEYYLYLSSLESDIRKKLKLLEKAEKIVTESLKLAKDSDIPWVIFNVYHTMGKTLVARALMDADTSERRDRLEKALTYEEKTLRFAEEQYPFDYWSQGVMHAYLARIKRELATIEPDETCKRQLLEEAVSNMKRCLKFCNKDLPYFESVGNLMAFAPLHKYQESYGTLLTSLYDLTHKAEYLRKAIDILKKSIESASKVDLISRIAEAYWKIAKAQNALEEYLEASNSFELASESYTRAAEKISQLRDFYQDYATYMKAWSEIKKAKGHHAEKQYEQAKEHYEKAANLHDKTERWKHLSSNYFGLALMEGAEDLSRKEKTQEAMGLFQQAAKLFAETGKSIRAKLKKIRQEDEREMAAELDKASVVRREYCFGRIILEEAKMLDRQGNHFASSQKYRLASEKLQRTIDTMEHESDRKELRPIVTLTQAWQMMTQAEAEVSSDLYLEAAKLFDQAKELSVDEDARVLASGHSSFCKALEAGTRFEATRDKELYQVAIRHLESASNYYVKAGFKNASEYAKATKRLFDAYIYVDKADTETAPKKKAQYYQMAEKLLQASAGSYMKAKHPEKGEEVQRLHESVKEERELAVSLAEVLHVPLTASTTTSFSTPTTTLESAVGLEIFEHANIQANFLVQDGDINVGEDVVLEIEMVNSGKEAATLVKIENIVPMEEFKVVKKPEMYRMEDSYLNMKGRRLNPLKTEDVRMIVKPRSKGKFTVKPRILYLDETGKYKSHEPEPVTITVRELGISGWIKGEK